MSGGAWNYFYARLGDAADRLDEDRDPLRRALGAALRPFVAALHDVEWVDSGDYGPGGEHDAIRVALGEGAEERSTADAVVDALNRAEELVERLKALRG